MIGFLIQRFLIKFPNKKVLTSLMPNASVGLSSDASLLFLYILSCKNIYPLVMSLCPYISYLCRRAISPTGILHGCCTLSSMGSFNAGLQILWTVRIENPAPSFCGSVGPPVGESFAYACTSIHSFVLFLLL